MVDSPANLKLISTKIAEIKKIEQEEIEKITFKNSKKVFGL
jgi:Tat protein secretion system quality control protein TatD with DNase activity